MSVRARVFLEKAEDLLPRLPADSFDSIVCDPPYELTSGKKGGSGEASLNPNSPAGRSRIGTGNKSGGFMGKAWDATGVPMDPGFWCEVLRVLKPGGHLVAFGAPRTYHRMACAIEDAGFEVRDSLHWMYGSGFPKGLDVSKAIDKVGGISPKVQGAVLRAARERAGFSRAEVAERVGCKEASVQNWEDGRARAAGCAVEYITPSPQYRDALADLLGYTADERQIVGTGGGSRSLYESGHRGIAYGGPVTEDAVRWSGWNVALKPAHEPIILARKPLSEGTVAANVLRWGTGALNVDGCKAGSEQRTNNAGGVSSLQRVSRVEQGYRQTVTTSEGQASETAGRWPPNLLLTHSADCVPAGTRRVRANGDGGGMARSGYEGGDRRPGKGHADADGTETVQAFTCAPDCPVAGLDAQSGNVKSGGNITGNEPSAKFKTTYGEISGRAPYEVRRDTGGASRFFPAFTWSPEYDLPFMYQAKAPKKERPRIVTDDGRVIQHPTVKPLALMRWLVRLVTPPGGTVGDFFTGTGPVVQAALDEGMRCVACDQDPDSVALSRVRLAPYAGVKFTVPEPAEKTDAEAECG